MIKYTELLNAVSNGNTDVIISMLEKYFRQLIKKAHHDAEAIDAAEKAEESAWIEECAAAHFFDEFEFDSVTYEFNTAQLYQLYEFEYEALMDSLRDAIYCASEEQYFMASLRDAIYCWSEDAYNDDDQWYWRKALQYSRGYRTRMRYIYENKYCVIIRNFCIFRYYTFDGALWMAKRYAENEEIWFMDDRGEYELIHSANS